MTCNSPRKISRSQMESHQAPAFAAFAAEAGLLPGNAGGFAAAGFFTGVAALLGGVAALALGGVAGLEPALPWLPGAVRAAPWPAAGDALPVLLSLTAAAPSMDLRAGILPPLLSEAREARLGTGLSDRVLDDLRGAAEMLMASANGSFADGTREGALLPLVTDNAPAVCSNHQGA